MLEADGSHHKTTLYAVRECIFSVIFFHVENGGVKTDAAKRGEKSRQAGKNGKGVQSVTEYHKWVMVKKKMTARTISRALTRIELDEAPIRGICTC